MQPKEFYRDFLETEASNLRCIQNKESQLAEKARKFKEFASRQQEVLASAENLLMVLGATEEGGSTPDRKAFNSVLADGDGGGSIKFKRSTVDMSVRQFECVSPLVDLGRCEYAGEPFSSGVQIFLSCRETRKVVKTGEKEPALFSPEDEVTGFGLRYLMQAEGSEPTVVKTFYSSDAHINPGLVEHGSDETLARLAFDSNQLATIAHGLNEIVAAFDFSDETNLPRPRS